MVIYLMDKTQIEVKENEFEIKGNLVVGVNNTSRQGFIIPMTAISYIDDETIHKEE